MKITPKQAEDTDHTRVALVDLKTNEVIAVYPKHYPKITLPNGNQISPLIPGWRGGGDLIWEEKDVELTDVDENGKEVKISRRKKVATESEPFYMIAKVLTGTIAKDRIITERVFTFDPKKDVVNETFISEPKPQPKERTAQQKLEDMGLTKSDLLDLFAEDIKAIVKEELKNGS